MVPDMIPLFYIVFMAIGGAFGLVLSILLWVASFFIAIPSIALLAMPVVGALGGIAYASWGDK